MGIFDLMNKTDTRYTMQREDGKTVYNPPGQHMKILKDCMELMDSTTNPDTFFYRAKLASEKAMYCEHEPQIIWKGIADLMHEYLNKNILCFIGGDHVHDGVKHVIGSLR